MIPAEDPAKCLKELDLKNDPLPLERALEEVWCIESDSFQFHIELRDRPLTQRVILATVSYKIIYDPSGFVAPVTLKGKQALQQMCRDKLKFCSLKFLCKKTKKLFAKTSLDLLTSQYSDQN